MKRRTGAYVLQPAGYRAFIPESLPPNPAVQMDEEMQAVLSRADRALARLDGICTVLPNPDLFVAMFVRHESTLSSQIEGTQSTLEDVLEFEVSEEGRRQPKDIQEVVNYVRAMNYGLALLPELPLSLRLLREIHDALMQGVRGGEKTPGEFRKTQNWIGNQGVTLTTASFVPPPPFEMMQALDNLEKFLHTRRKMPILIQCGLAHAQFETIHPFLDGNGRVGRLLITLMLCAAKVLSQPLLYLSYYLKQRRQEYYDRLTAVRMEGDWEGWLKFFLSGVAEVSEYATLTARKILALRENHRQKFCDSALLMRFLDHLFQHPVTNIKYASEALGVTYMTARSAVDKLLETGLLVEITGFQRNKIYRYQQYIQLFSEQTLPEHQ